MILRAFSGQDFRLSPLGRSGLLACLEGNVGRSSKLGDVGLTFEAGAKTKGREGW